jgi:hypothetical protein
MKTMFKVNLVISGEKQIERCVQSMKEFTWKVFCETGSIDTYLLYKEFDHEITALSAVIPYEESLEEPPLH